MNFIVLVVARAVCTAVFSALASTSMTSARSEVATQFYDAASMTYLGFAGRSYVAIVPLSICFNVFFFYVMGRELTEKRLKQFAFLATLFFWVFAAFVTSLYTTLPFSSEFWWVTTICCGLGAAFGASELCAKGLKLLGLL